MPALLQQGSMTTCTIDHRNHRIETSQGRATVQEQHRHPGEPVTQSSTHTSATFADPRPGVRCTFLRAPSLRTLRSYYFTLSLGYDMFVSVRNSMIVYECSFSKSATSRSKSHYCTTADWVTLQRHIAGDQHGESR